jgi:hypothetical protein
MSTLINGANVRSLLAFPGDAQKLQGEFETLAHHPNSRRLLQRNFD